MDSDEDQEDFAKQGGEALDIEQDFDSEEEVDGEEDEDEEEELPPQK